VPRQNKEPNGSDPEALAASPEAKVLANLSGRLLERVSLRAPTNDQALVRISWILQAARAAADDCRR